MPIFIRATYEFSLYAVHVPGAQNWWADALSQGNMNFLHPGETVSYQQATLSESLTTLLQDALIWYLREHPLLNPRIFK